MSSFSDSARCRCPLVSPADVRLNIARRPRSEVERVGGVSLAVCEVCRCGGESCSRLCANGEDVWGIDTETRDIAMGDGEDERDAMLGGYVLELAWRCDLVSAVPCVGVGGCSRNLVMLSLRFESMPDVISTR